MLVCGTCARPLSRSFACPVHGGDCQIKESDDARDEALRIALTALEWYADPAHWFKDDWGIRAVISSPDYSHERAGGQKARNALKRVERLTKGTNA